jgi:hypothetical protein
VITSDETLLSYDATAPIYRTDPFIWATILGSEFSASSSVLSFPPPIYCPNHHIVKSRTMPTRRSSRFTDGDNSTSLSRHSRSTLGRSSSWESVRDSVGARWRALKESLGAPSMQGCRPPTFDEKWAVQIDKRERIQAMLEKQVEERAKVRQ